VSRKKSGIRWQNLGMIRVKCLGWMATEKEHFIVSNTVMSCYSKLQILSSFSSSWNNNFNSNRNNSSSSSSRL
jgi:hypothetical protein